MSNYPLPPPPPPPSSITLQQNKHPQTTIITKTTASELICDSNNNNNNSYGTNNENKNNNSSPTLIHYQPHLTFSTSGECIWANQYPEIQKACYLRRVCQYARPKELRVQNVASILQVGPTCGLTALSMLFEGSPSTTTLLELAIGKGYSNNGEMFSARQLADLLAIGLQENCHLVEYKPVTHTLQEGNLDSPENVANLRQGSIFLVPYDPDRDHTPCLNQGHKAHWALVVGYLIDQYDEYYVFARHGKTKNMALWSLRDLAHSNANLFEFCQPSGHPEGVFVLPEGGIGGRNGLRNKFIVIENYKAKEEIVL
ncbi:actin maturation protease [Uranotaenia lowii]|uniref:actin maturation protease n=1 Tax=Uranotaenia lowii TaxID=190385 RepID=UPI002479B548|nr:actin maturation protease [Uranotaenia lowii]